MLHPGDFLHHPLIKGTKRCRHSSAIRFAIIEFTRVVDPRVSDVYWPEVILRSLSARTNLPADQVPSIFFALDAAFRLLFAKFALYNENRWAFVA